MSAIDFTKSNSLFISNDEIVIDELDNKKIRESIKIQMEDMRDLRITNNQCKNVSQFKIRKYF